MNKQTTRVVIVIAAPMKLPVYCGIDDLGDGADSAKRALVTRHLDDEANLPFPILSGGK